MSDTLALRERYITKLRRWESYRRSFQAQADLESASQKLKGQGLERLVEFDRNRAATFPEMGLQFQARAAGTPEHDKHAQELIASLPPFLHRMLHEFDTSIQTGRNADDISATLGNKPYEGSNGKTLKERAHGVFLAEAKLAATFADKVCAKDMNCRLQTHRTVSHEIGHAVNMYLGYISKSPAFLKAYETDVLAMRKGRALQEKNALLKPPKEDASDAVPAARKRNDVYMTYFGLAHHLTKADGGNHDTKEAAAAEVFSETVGDYINKSRYKNDPDFKMTFNLSRYYPESAKFVDKLMADLEKYYAIATKPLVPN
jgi:hypothetical protein